MTKNMIQSKKKFAATASILLIVATLTVKNLGSFQGQLLRTNNSDINHRQLQLTSYMREKVLPFSEICPAETPPLHPTLHNFDKKVTTHHDSFFTNASNRLNSGNDIPELVTMQNVKYAFWNKGHDYQASVWAAQNPNDYLDKKGGGFMKPREEDAKKKVGKNVFFQGDYAVFHCIYYKSYGHFGHDHLPTIAFLRTSVPESTKFLLIDHPIARKAIAEIDPTFYRRVTWIQERQVYHITGSLTVAVRQSFTYPVGCCSQFDALRNWMAASLPEDPPEKTVVYYQRKGSGSKSRILDEANEQAVLEHIRLAMERHGMTEKLVIFNGRTPGTDDPMPVYDQFRLFRSAKTIIGPEGSGIGGNFVYTKPNPQNCHERVQLLEFMGGKDTPEIHDGTTMVSHFQSIRKWPIEYHNIYFTPESNKWTTYVNLDELDCALNMMWGNGNTHNSNNAGAVEVVVA